MLEALTVRANPTDTALHNGHDSACSTTSTRMWCSELEHRRCCPRVRGARGTCSTVTPSQPLFKLTTRMHSKHLSIR
eukprot:746049-Rhodomonas_salina.2